MFKFDHFFDYKLYKIILENLTGLWMSGLTDMSVFLLRWKIINLEHRARMKTSKGAQFQFHISRSQFDHEWMG